VDTPVEQRFWQKWPVAARVGGAVAGITPFVFTAIALVIGDNLRTLRVPAAQLTVATVEQGMFPRLDSVPG
jgi:hypothetical protein